MVLLYSKLSNLLASKVCGLIVCSQQAGLARVPCLNEDPDVDLVALKQPLQDNEAGGQMEVIITPT